MHPPVCHRAYAEWVFRMWYDNLYLRAVFHNTPLEQQNRQTHYIGLAGLAPLKWPLRGLGARYITRVTLQGDGLGPTMGVWADESAYLESAPPRCTSLPQPPTLHAKLTSALLQTAPLPTWEEMGLTQTLAMCARPQ